MRKARRRVVPRRPGLLRHRRVSAQSGGRCGSSSDGTYVVPRIPSLTSANRSEPTLAAAERDILDVSRPAARHLAFGYGIHRCLGAPLAQLEAEIGIATLLRRFPDLRPTIPTAELSWIPAGMMRGPLSLPVTVTTATDRTYLLASGADPSRPTGGVALP